MSALIPINHLAMDSSTMNNIKSVHFYQCNYIRSNKVLELLIICSCITLKIHSCVFF